MTLVKVDMIMIKLVNGILMQINQAIITELIFNEKIITQIFYYMPTLTEEALLGMDFYKSANLNLIARDNKNEEEVDPMFKSPEAILYTEFEVSTTNVDSVITSSYVRQIFSILLNKKDMKNEEIFNLFNLDIKNKGEIFEGIIQTKDPIEKEFILQFLNENSDLFALDLSQLGTAKNVFCEIDTGDHEPIATKQYRFGWREKLEIQKQVKEMLSANIIVKARSPWNSPVVLVHKNDKYRFCIDFRKLNQITKTHNFPIPFIEDLLDNLGESPILSIFDLKSGFHQIKMAPDSMEKTAFTADNQTYMYRVMPFGLKNAPSLFMEYMNTIFEDHLNRFISVYLDDVIIYSKSFEDHLEHLKLAFNIIRENNLKLHAEKSKFVCEEIGFLGFKVGRHGIRPDEERVAAIKYIPIPKKVRDIKSFIGSLNYYRKFIKDFATIAKPLTLLLKKGTKFEWTDECQKSFDTLKNALMSPPILSHLKREGPLILYTDASKQGYGAILCQVQDGEEKVLYYASRSLKPHEENYAASQLELAAMKWAVTEKFHHYLQGKQFYLKTDHCALCWLIRSEDPGGKLQRWSWLLMPYDFIIQYRSGKNHLDVDLLSRNAIKRQLEADNELPMFEIEELKLEIEQGKDSWIRNVKQRIKENRLKRNEEYILENDILYAMKYDSLGIKRKLLCLPSHLRTDILYSMHDDKISGHVGFIKTLYKTQERFFFPKMPKVVRKYVRSCKICQAKKTDSGPIKGELQQITSNEPYEIVGVDILGPLPITKNRNKYIILCIDYFTKYLEGQAIKKADSENTADFLIEKIILRHGCIMKILTDRGTNFCSDITETIFNAFKIKHIKTSSWHPQTNGLVEKSCGIISQMLAMYVKGDQKKWDLFLPYLLFAYNTARQETTKHSPFRLMYGRDARIPIDLNLQLPSSFIGYGNMDQRFNEARELVKQIVIETKRKQKVFYDKKRKKIIFKPGDRVLLWRRQRKKGVAERFQSLFSGPFQVLDSFSSVSYLLEDMKTGKRTRGHVSRMKAYYDDKINDEDLWEEEGLRPTMSKVLSATKLKGMDEQLPLKAEGVNQSLEKDVIENSPSSADENNLENEIDSESNDDEVPDNNES